MPSCHEGILDSKQWDNVKFEALQEKATGKSWRPQWKSKSSLETYQHGIRGLIARLFRGKGPSTRETMRPTAYLDGLRGFAAFVVYWHHHQLWVHKSQILENGFGYNGEYHFATFPFVRNFFTGGHYAVVIFFVISGYVLALKPLSLVHSGELVKLGDAISSALFRRWLRLFLPIFIITGIYAASWHIFGIRVSNAKQQGNLWDELWMYYCDFKNLSFIFNQGGNPWFNYNIHLWTIPAEFKGSIVVYTSILAFSRCSQTARLWCTVILMHYFMYISDGWYCAVFLAGMLLCDLELLAKKGELPMFIQRLAPLKEVIAYHLLLFSLFLGGVPSESNKIEQLGQSRGWYYLSFLKPQAVFDYKWFYLFWAATFFVGSLPRIGWLKRFFETSFCQYLGRISYALYMVHGPIMSTLGDRLYTAVGLSPDSQGEHIPHWVNKFPLPKAGPLGLEFSFLVPHLILLPTTLLLSEVVTRFVDTPSVKFAAWVHGRALGDAAPKQARA